MQTSSIRKLPEKVKKNGFEYRLVKRTDERAIYSQHAGLGQVIAYEVFKIKLGDLRKAKKRWADMRKEQFNEADYEEFYEKFPSDEDFGKTAWTYSKLAEAEKTFDSR